MEHIISGIEPFNDVFYRQDCFYNSLFPVITKYSNKISSILVNEIICYDTPEQGDSLRITYQNVSQKSLSGILQEEGIGVITEPFCDKITEQIISDLTQQHPVIIYVDCYYEPFREDTYQIEHLAHTLLVYGFNDEKREFYIIEHVQKNTMSYGYTSIKFGDLVQAYYGYRENFTENIAQKPSYYQFFKIDKIKHNHEPQHYQQAFIKLMQDNADMLFCSLECLRVYIDLISLKIIDPDYIDSHCFKMVSDYNSIISAMVVEKYRIDTLFGPLYGMSDFLGQIIETWKKIRNSFGKYMYSYDSMRTLQYQKILGLVILFQTIYQNQCNYIRRVISLPIMG
jgi:polyketide synthase PksJ